MCLYSYLVVLGSLLYDNVQSVGIRCEFAKHVLHRTHATLGSRGAARLGLLGAHGRIGSCTGAVGCASRCIGLSDSPVCSLHTEVRPLCQGRDGVSDNNKHSMREFASSVPDKYSYNRSTER